MENELEELTSKATKSTTDLNAGGAAGGNSNNDKIGEYVAAIVELKDKKYNKIIEMYKNKESIEKKIDKVAQPYKNILYYKYIKGLTLTEVAAKMGYCYVDICRKHGIALKLYKDVMKCYKML